MEIQKTTEGQYKICVSEKELFGLFILQKFVNGLQFAKKIDDCLTGAHKINGQPLNKSIVFETYDDSLKFLDELSQIHKTLQSKTDV